MKQKDLEEKNKIVKQKIADLLKYYEEGWDIFKNANAAQNWDYPLVKKKSSENVPDLPSDWLDLVERVQAIIAREKYALDVYPNTIDVITANQMLDAYASVGLPEGYMHWQFGKQREIEGKKFEKGQMGLAFEIVINTDPAIAYCMENNTPLMQMLVIAHACFGHNNFFKNNTMFKQFTEANNIIWHLKDMGKYVEKCGEIYGVDAVEELLDMCHALRMHSVDHYNKPKPKTLEQQKQEALEKRMKRFTDIPVEKYRSKEDTSKDDFSMATTDEKPDPERPIYVGGESNIVKFIANNAPHMEEWQRELLHRYSYVSQYFYPQIQTKVMNEGWASFWHYTILHDMRDLDLIDDGMMIEFKNSHSGVIKQPEFDETITVMGPDGQPKQVPIYDGINPYAIGFAMFMDLKRICEEPTEEDKEWLPHIAGKGDWLNVLKHAMESFKDDTFFLQYLSPKVIRDFKLFATLDIEQSDEYIISAVQDKKGYQRVREALADNHRLSSMVPRLQVEKFYNRTDRRLEIHHIMKDGKPLEPEDADLVLRHIYKFWEHPVVLKSVAPDKSVVHEMSCPERSHLKQDYTPQERMVRPG